MFSRRKGRCCITATRRSSNAPLNPPVVSFAASSNNSPVSPATLPTDSPEEASFVLIRHRHVQKHHIYINLNWSSVYGWPTDVDLWGFLVARWLLGVLA